MEGGEKKMEELPVISRKPFYELSDEEAKKLGHNLAVMLGTLQLDVVNLGVKPEDALELSRSIASKGDCSSGGMCFVFT
jgi:hypothetical protein